MPSQDPELQRMQQDAVRRVREMQARAQSRINTPAPNMPNMPNAHGRRENAPLPASRPTPAPLPHAAQGTAKPVPVQQPPVPAPVPQTQKEPVPATEKGAAGFSPETQKAGPPAAVRAGGPNLLDFLTKDSERTLLLVLILLLKEEGADLSLLFALMYLVL